MKNAVALWLSWTLATAIGSALGFLISAVLGPLFSWDEYGFYFGLVQSFVCGLTIGFGQWTIIRARSKKAWRWILATAIGIPAGIYAGILGLAFPIPSISFGHFFVPDYIVSTGCFAGLIIGIFQGISLRTKISKALRWVLVSVLSWGIGIALSTSVFNSMPDNSFTTWGWFYNFAMFTILGMFIGATTGAISGIFVKPFIVNSPLPRFD